MPSFDVVSEVDLQEVRNAVDQANREVGTRFDFKGSKAEFSLDGAVVTLHAQSEFQLEQMTDVIVRQTDDLRRIVDEFSKFARMPEPELRMDDLAALLRGAVTAARCASLRPSMMCDTSIGEC